MKQSDISDALQRTQPAISQVLAGEYSQIAGDDLDALERLFSCQFIVGIRGEVQGVSVLEYLPETSELIPFVWVQILQLLELDVVIRSNSGQYK